METPAVRVMHIASGDLWAGAEVQLFTLCCYLQKIPNITLSVILLNHGELANKLKSTGVEVLVIDESRFSGLQILKQLITAINASDPDVIHTHRQKENILGSIAATICRKPSIRSLHGASEHPSGFRQPVQKIQHFLDYFTARFLQKRIIAVSFELEADLKKIYPSNKISTIENGIDYNLLRPLAKIKTPASPYKVGIIGRLVPVKRVDIFINTAKIWAQAHPDSTVSFHIYGDGPLRKELEKLSKSLNTQNSVLFEGHCSNIHEEISTLNALLITSDHEGLPMTLLEALTLGTPIIANPVGAIPRVLGYGKYGRLVNSQTADAFTAELHGCISDKEETMSKSKQAQEHIRNAYSAQTNAEKMHDIYKTFL